MYMTPHSNLLDSRKHISTPSGHSCEQSGRKVPSGIDSVTSIETKGHPNSPEQETNHERLKTSPRLRVLGVTDGKYTQHQQKSAEYLQSNMKPDNCANVNMTYFVAGII